MATNAALVLAAIAIVAPLVTWLPNLTRVAPWLPLPNYPAVGDASLLWQLHVWWSGLAAFLAWLVWAKDRWLGAAVGLVALQTIVRGPAVDLASVIAFAAVAFGVTVLRDLGPVAHRWIAFGFVWSGVFQALYCALQKWGHTDPLWNVWHVSYPLRVIGTLGNEDYVGAYVAMVAPLASWWILPILALGLIATHSGVGLVAFALAVGWKFRHRYAGSLVVVPLVIGIALRQREAIAATLDERLTIWGLGLRDWLTNAPTWGVGLGRFYDRCPSLQAAQGIHFGKGALWGIQGVPLVCTQAHNEYLQWIYETGAAGLVVLGGWLWTHRREFLSGAWGAAALATAIVSLGLFPFHIVATALLGTVIVALATAEVPTSAQGA